MIKFLETPITVIHVIACLFMVLVILVQPGRSGGLGAAFGGAGAQQVFGGRGATNLLAKITWILMSVFFLTSILLAYMSSSGDEALEEAGKANTKLLEEEEKKEEESKSEATPAPSAQ